MDGAGLLLAAGTGGRLVVRTAFPDLAFSYVDVPWIGSLPVASALLFDIGVFLLVSAPRC